MYFQNVLVNSFYECLECTRVYLPKNILHVSTCTLKIYFSKCTQVYITITSISTNFRKKSKSTSSIIIKCT